MTNMSDEIKNETAESIEGDEPKNENADAEPQAEDEESKEDLHPDKGIDYAQIAEQEKVKREKAEKAAADAAYKLRQQRRQQEETIYEEEDRPLTRKEVLELLSSRPSDDLVTKKDLMESKANLIAEKFAGSLAEKDAIVETWKNRTFPEGLSLDDQLEETYAIVNRKKIIGERNEALRALKGKSGASKDSASTHHDPLKGSEPQLDPGTKQVLSQSGFVYRASAGRYEKKLPNGKTLIKDPRTGKVSVLGERQAPVGA